MKAVAIVAAAGISGLGEGESAWSVGDVGERAKTAILEDPVFRAAGLRKPFSSRIHIDVGRSDNESGERDRASVLLERVSKKLVSELDQRLPSWRTSRRRAVIGTSAGGMTSQERAFQARDGERPIPAELGERAPYFGPLKALPELFGLGNGELSQVLAACASSAVAIGVGCRILELDGADLVIAGGYDALSVFVAAGFEALGATTAALPAPFRRLRDGMAIGEGAALVALVRELDFAREPLGYVLGFAATSDAVHVTAPDRSGAGLARAARAALADAATPPEDIDLVSAHGTATPFNDAAEAKAMNSVLGEHAERVVVHPFKAAIGHTLGAASALESLAALDALERGVLPAALGTGEREPELSGRLLERNTAGEPRCCLKLSAAFGGANAALVLGRRPQGGVARGRRELHVLAIGEPQSALDVDRVLALRPADRTKLMRLDPVSALALAAATSAIERLGRPISTEAGVVVGTAAATIEVNDAYDARRRTRGARAVEPRRFPPTSPNLAPGEVSIVFGLRGPGFAVGAGLAAAVEALSTAGTLIALGDCDEVVVIAVDHVGPSVSAIFGAAGWPSPRPGAVAVVLGSDGGRPLSLESILERHTSACASLGQLDDQGAGWPAMLAALKAV